MKFLSAITVFVFLVSLACSDAHDDKGLKAQAQAQAQAKANRSPMKKITEKVNKIKQQVGEKVRSKVINFLQLNSTHPVTHSETDIHVKILNKRLEGAKSVPEIVIGGANRGPGEVQADIHGHGEHEIERLHGLQGQTDMNGHHSQLSNTHQPQGLGASVEEQVVSEKIYRTENAASHADYMNSELNLQGNIHGAQGGHQLPQFGLEANGIHNPLSGGVQMNLNPMNHGQGALNINGNAGLHGGLQAGLQGGFQGGIGFGGTANQYGMQMQSPQGSVGFGGGVMSSGGNLPYNQAATGMGEGSRVRVNVDGRF